MLCCVILNMLKVQQYPFIFSDDKEYRIRRHLAFWTTWWLFAGFLYSPVTWLLNLNYFQNLLRSLLESFAFLPIHIFLAYSLIYFVIPNYLLKGKYKQTILLVVLFFMATALISVVISSTIIPEIRNWFRASTLPSFLSG